MTLEQQADRLVSKIIRMTLDEEMLSGMEAVALAALQAAHAEGARQALLEAADGLEQRVGRIPADGRAAAWLRARAEEGRTP